MPAVHLEHLSFSHTSAVDVLTDVTIHLGAGWTGVVGPNGVGKRRGAQAGYGVRAGTQRVVSTSRHTDQPPRLPSIERLEAAIGAYPGAVVVVTHDEHFAAAATDLRWEVVAGGLVRREARPA